MRFDLRALLTENLSYKFVSLLIAFILWVTILGRRDFTLSKTIDVEIQTATGYAVSSQSAESVKVKVSGPRTALKKFMDSGMSQLINIDVSHLKAGEVDLEVPIKKIDVPFGVKVISVRPALIRASITKVESGQ